MHRRAWLSEFTGTAIVLFAEVWLARVVFLPGPALGRAVESLPARLALIGLATGILLAVLIVSPLSLSSGGHFNPAVTITLWVRRGEPAANDVAGYAVAQLLGSVLGVLLARVALGPVVANPNIDYAAVRPDRWTDGAVFFGEALWFGILMVPVLFFMSQPALARWTPVVVGVGVAGLIVAGGLTSGGGLNPARQLGPALFAQQWPYFSSYLLAPVVGGVALALILKWAGRLRPRTCSLCGIPPRDLPLPGPDGP